MACLSRNDFKNTNGRFLSGPRGEEEKSPVWAPDFSVKTGEGIPF